MGNGNLILEACEQVLQQVQLGAKSAEAEIEMGDSIETYVLKISCHMVRGEETLTPKKKKKKAKTKKGNS